MSKLLSALGITFFGSFSAVAFAEPTTELEFDKKEINQEIQISLSQSMEELMINLFNEDHQTFLIAKKEDKPAEKEQTAEE
ncbi:hypothetical protein JQC92_19485 [Shewanella sp. 202IG2-18]|uniref:hypothetical protein n=1 Tax=Parashewanella hymeniacidonis TaxID=2807618 RepID=UPI0019602307|nr:hypothetical protein [Parashewanella hymeniacidonis]MBM7074184.1 hypothetical protein [Parashewanella hymeniacidonis]